MSASNSVETFGTLKVTFGRQTVGRTQFLSSFPSSDVIHTIKPKNALILILYFYTHNLSKLLNIKPRIMSYVDAF